MTVPLLCKNGLPHFCANCGNRIEVASQPLSGDADLLRQLIEVVKGVSELSILISNFDRERELIETARKLLPQAEAALSTLQVSSGSAQADAPLAVTTRKRLSNTKPGAEQWAGADIDRSAEIGRRA